jgi:GTP cyclohydrolase I
VNYDLIENGMRQIMRGMEMDLNDPALSPTPERYRRFLQEIFETDHTKWATFEEEYTDFVLLRGHTLYTLCPHHFIPVELKVSLAYIPNGKVLGLSKLARVLHDANRGPVMQEKFTRDVVSRIKMICKGTTDVAVFVDGEHGCMKMRGIKSNARLTTYRCEGVFDTDPVMQQRFFTLVKQ